MKRFVGDKQGEDRNQFRFLSFSERLAQVNVDIFRTKTRQSDIPLEGLETHFQREVNAWFDRTQTESFLELFEFLRPKIISLPMILHHLEEIVAKMNTMLEKQDVHPDTAQAILSLLAILSRDMRSEFYPLFPTVLKHLVDKLDIWRTDSDMLEKLFESLSYMFKFLQRHLVKDLKEVFDFFIQFFDNPKPYVREFAAESFSFLIRKLPEEEVPAQVAHMAAWLDREDRLESENLVDGLALLYFHTVKGIKTHLNSALIPMMRAYMQEMTSTAIVSTAAAAAADESSEMVVRAPGLRRFAANLKLMQKMRKHLSNKENEELWGVLQEQLSAALAAPAEAGSLRAELVLRLMSEWTRNRHMSFKTKPEDFVISSNQMQRAVSACVAAPAVALLSSRTFPCVLELFSILLKTQNHMESKGIQFNLANMSNLMRPDAILETICETIKGKQKLVVSFLRFAADQVELEKFCYMFVGLCFKFVDWHLAEKERSELFGVPALEFWRRVLARLNWLGASGPYVESENARLIPQTSALSNLAITVMRTNLDLLLSPEPEQIDSLTSLIWMCIEVLNHIRMVDNFEEVLSALQDASASVALRLTAVRQQERAAASAGNASDEFLHLITRLQFLLSELIQAETLLFHTTPADSKSEAAQAIEATAPSRQLVLLFGRVADAVASNSHSVFLLRAARLYLQSIFADQNKKDTYASTALSTISSDASAAKKIAAIQRALANNLSHSSHDLRSVTISVLTLINKIKFHESVLSSDPADIPTSFTQSFLEECQEIEDAALNPLEARAITVRIHRLKEILLHNQPQNLSSGKKNKNAASAAAQADAATRTAEGDRELLTRFLLGMFHKKLVLLWPMTKEILYFFAHQDYRRYWRILWPLFTNALFSQKSANFNVASDDAKVPDVEFEDEDEYTDNASDYASHILSPLGQGKSGDFDRALTVDVAHTDALAFSKQMWECVSQMHKLTQYSAAEFRPLIEMFIAFIQEKYPTLKDAVGIELPTSSVEISHFMDSSSKALLTEFLKFFAQFKMPSTISALAERLTERPRITAQPYLHQEDVLFRIFTTLLTHGNEQIQRLALDCVMLWKLEYLMPYREHLERLCSSKDLREVITAWRIGKAAGEIQPQHRLKVADYIINLVYPKLVAKGKHSSMLSSRRVALLSFVANLDPSELKPLFNHLFRSFMPILNPKATNEARLAAADQVDWKKHVGLLSLVEDLVKQMGSTLEPFLPDVITLVLVLLQAAIRRRRGQIAAAEAEAEAEEDAEADEEVDNEAEDDKAEEQDDSDVDADAMEGIISTSSSSKKQRIEKDAAVKIRKLALRRLGQIIREYPDWDFVPFKGQILEVIDIEIERLHEQVANPRAGSVLDLVLILSSNLNTAPFLAPPLEKILSCLKLVKISIPVRSELYSLLDNLLKLRDEAMRNAADSMDVDDDKKRTASAKPVDLVSPHVDLLLEAFQVRFQNDYGSRRRRIGIRELALVERLTPYATSTEVADQLVGLLNPFLRMKGIPLNGREHILLIFRNLIPLLTQPMSLAATVSRLFLTFPSPSSREAVCAVYEALAQTKAGAKLKVVAPLLTELNSFVRNRLVEEPDYDRRFVAYQTLNEDLLTTLDEVQLLPVVYNFLYFMTHSDISLRSNASHGLSKLIRHIAKDGAKIPRIAALVPDIILPAIKKNLDHESSNARAEYIDVLHTYVQCFPNHYPELTALRGEEADESNNFFINVLHLQMHRRTKAIHRFCDLVKAGTTPFSADCLMNVIFPIFKRAILESSQKQHNYVEELITAVALIARSVAEWSKYNRVMQTFIDAMPRLPLLEGQLVKLLVRVLDEFHFDVSKEFSDVASSEAPKKFTVDAPVTAEVKELFAADVSAAREGEQDVDEDAMIVATEDIAAAPRKSEKTQPTETVVEEPAEAGAEAEAEDEEESEDEKDVAAAILSEKDQQSRVIQRHLVNRTIPTLYARLKESKGSAVVRSSVAMALIKLLQLMPTSVSEFQIARLLTRLCAELASRAQANRDSARETLRQVLIKLGSRYLPFVLQMLETNLVKGYQLHVLSYTVHDLLQALVPHYQPGEIDRSLTSLLTILFNDMLGHQEEQRSEAKIANSMKETKRSYSMDSFQLMARGIDFKASSMTLIGPVRDALIGAGGSFVGVSIYKQSDVTLIKKLTDVFDQIVLGLKQNSSVKAEDLFVFCYLMLKENMDPESAKEQQEADAAEKAAQARPGRPRKPKVTMDPRKAAKFLVEPDPRKMRSKVEAILSGNEHMMAVFALQLLQTFLKAAESPGQSPIDRKSAQHIAMLDPFVKLLFKCMTSRFDRLLLMSLKVLCQIIKIPNVPTIQHKSQAIGKRAIVLMQKANPASELLQMAFKTITTLYREVHNFDLGDHHLGIVLNYLRSALEQLENPNLVFSLLKSLVWRRVMHPAIYDMMPHLMELLTQTAAQSVRTHCESIIMQFLLTYPLGEKRLQQHLDTLMANLNYEMEPGRLAVLSVLNAVFARFPQQVLQSRLEYFALPLVAQMINDDSKTCRARAAEVVSTLIKFVDADHRSTLLNMTVGWLTPTEIEDPAQKKKRASLQLAAIRLIPLFVPHYAVTLAGGASSEIFDKFVQRVLPVLKQILLESTYGATGEDDSEDDAMDTDADADLYSTSVGWQLLYLTMVSLEKILQHQAKLTARRDFTEILEWLGARLLHPHSWIRLLAARIFGLYFGYINESKLIENKLKQREKKSRKSSSSSDDADDAFILRPRALFILAKTFCKELESEALTPELGTQIVKNLLFAGVNLLRFPALTPVSSNDEGDGDSAEAALSGDVGENDDEDQDDEEQQQQQAADEGEEDSDDEEKPLRADDDDSDDEATAATAQQTDKQKSSLTPLEWIFRRLSYMARKEGTLKRTCVFQYFAAISLQLTQEELSSSPRAYLIPMINPLFRIHENDEIKAEDPVLGELKQLAGEVLDLIKKRAGTQAFLAAYEAVRRSVSRIRGERKQARKIMAIADPRRHAQRKLKKHQRGRERKKRKIEDYKVNRTRLKVRKME